MRIVNLAKQLWNDDCGAIIAAEYIMLGSVLMLGTAQGLATLRDSTNQELQEMGSAVRETRQHYTPQLPSSTNQQTPVKGTQAAATFPSQTQGYPQQSSPHCPGGVCP